MNCLIGREEQTKGHKKREKKRQQILVSVPNFRNNTICEIFTQRVFKHNLLFSNNVQRIRS